MRAEERHYELADFEPSDGHLHTCGGVDKDGGPRREPNGECGCAAALYEVARDLEMEAISAWV